VAIGQSHAILDHIALHLHVCPIESKELQKHIAFRDYLRTNEKAKMQHQQLKYRLADEAGQERKKYAMLKQQIADPVIIEMVAKATPFQT
jgi:GrpB-like predicted nucleotidyltransferase (UPF0157 family)